MERKASDFNNYCVSCLFLMTNALIWQQFNFKSFMLFVLFIILRRTIIPVIYGFTMPNYLFYFILQVTMTVKI